jgi:glutamine synthetase
LANARAASVFVAPTLNGYKRYRGVNTMAPIQAIWAKDNRGAMVRVMGEAGDPATHVENRCGEPLANPYLYMASQIYAGLDGMARGLDPGPSADAPYRSTAEALPGTLEEALVELRANVCFRAGFGDGFVDYYAKIKEAEIARYRKDAQPDKTETVNADVSEWEHREYFDML